MKKLFQRPGVTFIELLIAMIVVSIMGGVAVSALWFAFGIFNQTYDYVSASQEIEFVAQKIGREMTHVGLGMPNNRQGKGSFAMSFQNAPHFSPALPLMAYMGEEGEPWGGPVTVGLDNPGDVYDKAHMATTPAADKSGSPIYHGPELYYAWGVATGVRVKLPDNVSAGHRKSGDEVLFDVLDYDDGTTGLEFLERFKYGNKSIGLSVNDGKNPASWILLPTTKIPMLVTDVDEGSKTLRAVLAPGASRMRGPVTGVDEVVFPQVARLFRSADNELVQIIFGADYTNPSTNTRNVLAHNIMGLHFTYDPELRIVTMYIAAKGEESRLNISPPDGWPDDIADPLPAGSRLVVSRVNWRVRN